MCDSFDYHSFRMKRFERRESFKSENEFGTKIISHLYSIRFDDDLERR